MKHQLNSKTQARGREIIAAIFRHIEKHGPTKADDLIDLTQCHRQTVGKPNVMHFNDWARDQKIPFRFAVEGGSGRKPIIWSLISRNNACNHRV